MSLTSPKILTLDQIQLYSNCPRKFGYTLAAETIQPQPDFFRESIKALVKQCYINRSQHGYNPQWDTVKARVNKLCFADVDMSNKEAFQFAHKRSVELLTVLHYWYHKHFSEESREALVNIPLSVTVNRTVIEETLDIAVLDSKYKLIPTIFNDTDILPNMLYNNMKFKSLLWLVYKETGVIPEVTNYLVITQQGIHPHKVFNKTHMDVIDKYVNFIIRAIENSVFYPSVSSQCDTCEFQKICTA